MFNFTNQKAGTIAGLGGGQSTKTQIIHEVEVIDEKVDGKGVHYWATFAKGLQEQMKDIVEDRDAFQRIALERRANDAGLRAVIRYLLAELRKSQPNHPLLDKKVRDRIFNEFHAEEMTKALKANGFEEVWQPLERPDEKQSP